MFINQLYTTFTNLYLSYFCKQNHFDVFGIDRTLITKSIGENDNIIGSFIKLCSEDL